MRRFRLRNVKTATKIIGTFCIVCLVLITLGGAGIWTTAQMKDQTTAIAQRDIPQIVWLTAAQNAANNAERDLIQAALEPDSQLWQIQMAQTRTDQQALQDAFTHYLALDHSDDLTQDIAAARQVLALWDQTLTTLLQQTTFGSGTSTTAIIDTINTLWQPQSVALSQDIDHLIAVDRTQTDQAYLLATQLFTRLVWVLGIGVALAFALSISMGLYIALHIARPLVHMVSITHRVAQGQLDAIDDLLARYHGADEMGQFLVSFNSMLAGLRQLIGRVLAAQSTAAEISASLDEVPTTQESNGLPGNALAQAAHQIETIDQLNHRLMQTYQELTESHKQLEIAHQTIQQQALTDPLTGLPNHRALIAQLDKEVQRAERIGHALGVIFFDGDRFKRVNDTHGHAAGDAVLRQLGERVQAVLRAMDTLGRYGGEEFVVVLPDVDREQALTIAERMRAAVASAPLATELITGGLDVTISAGVALYPVDAHTATEVLRKADQAMYLAKQSGRNRVCDAGDIHTPHVKDANLEHVEEDERLRDVPVDPHLLRQWMQAERYRMVAALIEVIRLYDREMADHSERVSQLSVAIAQTLGASAAMLTYVAQAGLLHDIGMIGIDTGIVQKPDPLTHDEWQRMQQHARMSGEVITSSQILRDLLPGVRHHHEHWDGSGYPDGLRGEQIPLEARIIAIADAYDAMCHVHAYKEALTSAEALAEIQRCAGTQFDPHLAPIASQAIEQFEAHHAHHQAA